MFADNTWYTYSIKSWFPYPCYRITKRISDKTCRSIRCVLSTVVIVCVPNGFMDPCDLIHPTFFGVSFPDLWLVRLHQQQWTPKSKMSVINHNKIQSCQRLTHLPLDKMVAISQTTFSNAFSWMKSFAFRFKFHWSLFQRVQSTINQHWFM